MPMISTAQKEIVIQFMVKRHYLNNIIFQLSLCKDLREIKLYVGFLRTAKACFCQK